MKPSSINADGGEEEDYENADEGNVDRSCNKGTGIKKHLTLSCRGRSCKKKKKVSRVSVAADDKLGKPSCLDQDAASFSSDEFQSNRASAAACGIPLADVRESMPSTSPWVDLTLVCIRNARHHVTHCHEKSLLHPNSLESNIQHLRRIRTATLDLLNCTDDVISSAHATQSLRRETALKQELASVQKLLTQSQFRYTVSLRMLRDAKSELDNQKTDFQIKTTALESFHDAQKTALLANQRALERQLEDEKEKSVCRTCGMKPRDTIVLPCLHFQYCFGCLLRHREVNGSTCPLCRGPIQGINMLSSLAGQILVVFYRKPGEFHLEFKCCKAQGSRKGSLKDF
ncbi:hypothetical protein GOP47_0024498 [Adiantum capillus-veneris]|uniref:RING-type domain-containing protein n=1 Tax=Adiantum capillus-veneris TaxID=13818 RepID=A0A9D4U311_ADICA|nr:hypothetical protein GOP47_0024498 [Adiantum capillus-veneris]